MLVILSNFEKTWINDVEWMRPNVWNYYEYIGRRTNNDLESFYKQANVCLREKKSSIFKFHKKCDSNMTAVVHDMN